MKKIVSIILALCAAASLAACSGGTTGRTDQAGSDATTSATGGNELQHAGNESKSTEPRVDQTEKPEAPESQISFDGLTVVDNDECMISIVEIDPDNIWGYTLQVNLENKSEDKTYMFSVLSAAVDGLQCDPLFATEVAAGKKSVDTISFSDSILAENNIDPSDIELAFRVYNSDDWTADDVVFETVHVYPFGEENAKTFTREILDSDNVIIDNDYVTVTVIGYEEDSIWGYTVNLFLQNKTDTEIMFSADDASINGYMADPFWATSVIPGKCAFTSMSWSDSDLTEIGVEEIEEIEFNLRAYNSNDWSAPDFANETITLDP